HRAAGQPGRLQGQVRQACGDGDRPQDAPGAPGGGAAGPRGHGVGFGHASTLPYRRPARVLPYDDPHPPHGGEARAQSSSVSTSSSISVPRAGAYDMTLPDTSKPHFSSTRRDRALSAATRASSGRSGTSASSARNAAVAMPLPQWARSIQYVTSRSPTSPYTEAWPTTSPSSSTVRLTVPGEARIFAQWASKASRSAGSSGVKAAMRRASGSFSSR